MSAIPSNFEASHAHAADAARQDGLERVSDLVFVKTEEMMALALGAASEKQEKIRLKREADLIRNKEAAERAADLLDRQISRGIYPEPLTPDEQEALDRRMDRIARYRSLKEARRERLAEGAVWDGGRINCTRASLPPHDPRRGPKPKEEKVEAFVLDFTGQTSPTPNGRRKGGYYIPPKTEKGLRSRLSAFHMRVAIYTPRTDLRVSIDKDVVYTIPSKLFALDLPTLTVRRDWLFTIRVDMDAIWPSEADMVRDLQELVDRGTIPCLPNGYACPAVEGDEIVRPHLFWHLPPGHEVKTTPDGDSRAERLYFAVLVGLTKALEPLGADMGGIANPYRIKNPLSFLNRSAAINDDTYATLDVWRTWVDTGTTRADALVQLIQAIAQTDEETSNFAYITAGVEARRYLKALHEANDPAYLAALGDTDGMIRMVTGHLVGALRDLEPDTSKLSRIAYLCAKRYAGGWDPTKAGGIKLRGGYAPELKGIEDKAERRAEAGRITGRVLVSKTGDKVVDAILHLIERTGEMPSKAAVIKETGLSKNTVYARWTGAIERVHSGAVKKQGPHSLDQNLKEPARRTTSAVEALRRFCSDPQSPIELDTILISGLVASERSTKTADRLIPESAVSYRTVPETPRAPTAARSGTKLVGHPALDSMRGEAPGASRAAGNGQSATSQRPILEAAADDLPDVSCLDWMDDVGTSVPIEHLPVGLSLAEARLLPDGSTVRRVVTVAPPLEEWIDETEDA